MNDRYLYRAKRKDNGEWVIGYLYRLSENHPPFIMLCDRYGESHEVDQSTICQCTGLRDNTKTEEFPNGKLIFEHDIVNCIEAECCGEIVWNESEAGFYFDVLYEDGKFEEEHIYDYVDCMEVIGNIFDNPELLEVGEG